MEVKQVVPGCPSPATPITHTKLNNFELLVRSLHYELLWFPQILPFFRSLYRELHGEAHRACLILDVSHFCYHSLVHDFTANL